MQTQKDNLIHQKRLSENTEYYNNVFKKTEKIVSVIFYIVSETKVTNNSETHLELIKDKALKTHETSLETLALQEHEQTTGILALQYRLVALDSTIRIAYTSRVISDEIFTLLSNQLDAVLRYINNHYLSKQGLPTDELQVNPLEKHQPPKPTKEGTRRQRRVSVPAGDISTDAYLVYSQMTDRAERIKTVLEAKPGASVKDISEVITDVSEKTIQRELNSLIEKGQVTREGERRWSRYSVSK